MKILLLKDDIIIDDLSGIVLYTHDLSEEEKTNLFDNISLPFADDLSYKENPLIAILPRYFSDTDKIDTYLEHYILLTANDSEEELAKQLDINSLKNILIYIKDFKDGRVFSLIRQIRQINATAKILVTGAFGLDQSSYFVKSGASGFVVCEDDIDTLTHTLNDLKTAQSRLSVHALPMFR